MPARVRVEFRDGRAAQEFTLEAGGEILIGRDPSCAVRFGENQDQVSRRHARVVMEDAEHARVSLADAGSRNGTYVNRRRISQPLTLTGGEWIQLGVGGPEFRVQATAVRQEVQAAPVVVPPPSPVRTAPSVQEPPRAPAKQPHPAPAPPHAPVAASGGKVGRRAPWALAVLVVLGLAAAMGYVLAATTYWVPLYVAAGGTFDAEAVGSLASGALAEVRSAWTLSDSASGKPLRQVYAENAGTVTGAPSLLPVFVLSANRLEPLLTTDAAGSGRRLGGLRAGTGVFVDSGETLAASASVAAPWDTPYTWPREDVAGLLQLRGSVVPAYVPIARSQFPEWIPSSGGPLAPTGTQRTAGSGALAFLKVASTAGERSASVTRVAGGLASIRVQGQGVRRPASVREAMAEHAFAVAASAGRTVVSPVRIAETGTEPSAPAAIAENGAFGEGSGPLLDGGGRLIAFWRSRTEDGAQAAAITPARRSLLLKR